MYLQAKRSTGIFLLLPLLFLGRSEEWDGHQGWMQPGVLSHVPSSHCCIDGWSGTAQVMLSRDCCAWMHDFALCLHAELCLYTNQVLDLCSSQCFIKSQLYNKMKSQLSISQNRMLYITKIRTSGYFLLLLFLFQRSLQ